MSIQEKKDGKLAKLNEWNDLKEILGLEFYAKESTVKDIVINKGEIFNCLLGENIGHETNKKRPVLIISGDFYNRNMTVVTVVPLSTTIKRKTINKNGRRRSVLRYSTHIELKKEKYDFLDADSVVMLEQIKTVCKTRIAEKLGDLQGSIEMGNIQSKLIKYLDV